MNRASTRNLEWKLAVAWGCAALALGGSACLHAPETGKATQSSNGQCLTVLLLNDAGGAWVKDEGAPGFVPSAAATARPRYLVAATAADPVSTVDQPACEQQGLCAPGQGPLPERTGMRPADEFRIAMTQAPAEVKTALPGVGERTVSLALGEDRFGEKEWRVFVQGAAPGAEPFVLYRAPRTLQPTEVTWYRAGDHLWLQFKTASEGLSCLVASGDLREAGVALLNDQAVAKLKEGDLPAAEATLRRALEQNPDDATAAYNLACALALQQRGDEAMAFLQRAFLLDPRNELRQLALEDPDLDSLRRRDDFRFLVSP